jgi:hypothetical protein
MMTPTAIKHGRCRFSNLKISEVWGQLAFYRILKYVF